MTFGGYRYRLQGYRSRIGSRISGRAGDRQDGNISVRVLYQVGLNAERTTVLACQVLDEVTRGVEEGLELSDCTTGPRGSVANYFTKLCQQFGPRWPRTFGPTPAGERGKGSFTRPSPRYAYVTDGYCRGRDHVRSWLRFLHHPSPPFSIYSTFIEHCVLSHEYQTPFCITQRNAARPDKFVLHPSRIVLSWIFDYQMHKTIFFFFFLFLFFLFF